VNERIYTNTRSLFSISHTHNDNALDRINNDFLEDRDWNKYNEKRNDFDNF
jgi:hypothetical protein